MSETLSQTPSLSILEWANALLKIESVTAQI